MQSTHASDDPVNAPRFVLPVRVYYEDTDAAGVVYYANYLRFCERARTEWLREIGFEQQRMLEQDGMAFVVRSVKADYLAPARLDDALSVVTTIDALRRASITFGQKIVRAETVLFSADIQVACVDWQRKKPAPLPDTVRTQLEKIKTA
ncbi:tol-pal system-associated acyl-CoA thioesterase [Azoarcus sp. L1K30]|uniref:tol-pal system-associated acyl-CoA thioesterase n=1 Tax=Azoarcus sp. L1K30 TaxID=2820277 RepID=UPI001B836051|nr:tol-pal system-associated acyl-CoA thioesterase [Azoarcus sp. L1K30]MBR0566732.1 tol-pal system-associated acyl-CoA thioesterase [Azoarcus sp. L1K30]